MAQFNESQLLVAKEIAKEAIDQVYSTENLTFDQSVNVIDAKIFFKSTIDKEFGRLLLPSTSYPVSVTTLPSQIQNAFIDSLQHVIQYERGNSAAFDRFIHDIFNNLINPEGNILHYQPIPPLKNIGADYYNPLPPSPNAEENAEENADHSSTDEEHDNPLNALNTSNTVNNTNHDDNTDHDNDEQSTSSSSANSFKYANTESFKFRFPEQQQDIICDFKDNDKTCNASFDNEEDFVDHAIKHHDIFCDTDHDGKSNLIKECTKRRFIHITAKFYCKKSECADQPGFIYKSGLNRHNELFHEENKMQCDFPECSIPYKSKQAKANHQKNKHKMKEIKPKVIGAGLNGQNISARSVYILSKPTNKYKIIVISQDTASKLPLTANVIQPNTANYDPVQECEDEPSSSTIFVVQMKNEPPPQITIISDFYQNEITPKLTARSHHLGRGRRSCTPTRRNRSNQRSESKSGSESRSRSRSRDNDKNRNGEKKSHKRRTRHGVSDDDRNRNHNQKSDLLCNDDAAMTLNTKTNEKLNCNEPVLVESGNMLNHESMMNDDKIKNFDINGDQKNMINLVRDSPPTTLITDTATDIDCNGQQMTAVITVTESAAITPLCKNDNNSDGVANNKMDIDDNTE